MFSVKDIRKLVVVSIIGACAVFVANLFLNFYLDIEQLEISKTNPMIQTYYDAQVSLSWMVAMVSGVVLSLTSILLMCFYIKQFVDDHKEQLGIWVISMASWRNDFGLLDLVLELERFLAILLLFL